MIRGRGYLRDRTVDYGGYGGARAVFTVVMNDWYIDGSDSLDRLVRSGATVAIVIDGGEVRVAQPETVAAAMTRVLRAVGETDEQLRARLAPRLAEAPAVETVPTAQTPPPAPEPLKEVTRFTFIEID